MGGRSHRGPKGLTFLLVIALLSGTLSAEAHARSTHVETGSFGTFPFLTAVAVDRVTNDLYVYEAGSEYGGGGTIQKFDAAGNPVAFSALGSPAGSSNVIDGADNGYGDLDAVPQAGIRSYGGTGATQMAVDNSNGPTQGDIYVSSSYDAMTFAFAATGEYLGTITDVAAAPYHGGTPCGVAVDSTGALYLAMGAHIDRFVPTGNVVQDADFTGQIRNPKPSGCRMAGGPPGIAMYLTGADPLEIETGPARPYGAGQFNGANNPATTPVGNRIWDVAVNQSSGAIYAIRTSEPGWVPGDQVGAYDAGGNLIDTFGEEGEVGNGSPFGDTYGIAVNPNDEVVYAPAPNQGIAIFSPAIVPDLATKPATGIERTGATLNGEVDDLGAGDVTSCHFEYGTDTSYGSTAPCSDSVPFSGARSVSAMTTGLQQEATYHFRLVVGNSSGLNHGKDLTFRTNSAVLDLATEEPQNVTSHSAELQGSFTGDNHGTTYYFEWGTTLSYGHTTTTDPGDQPGATVGLTTVLASIEGLDTFTPYHYRVVATNGLGTTYGADQLFFSAPPAPPQVLSSSYSDVDATSATLHAVVNPNDGDTVLRFDYGTGTAYELNTPSGESLGNDLVGHAGSAHLEGLEPGTVYHFRAVAINVGGTTDGPDQSFVTPDVPKIDSPSSSGVTQEGAVLRARITPNLVPTTYRFEYGLTAAYGAQTPESGSIGEDRIEHEAVQVIGGLATGVTYHFRVVATNSVGTVSSPDQTFTTVAVHPGEEPGPPPPHCGHGKVLKGNRCVRRRHRHHRRHTGRKSGGHA